MLPGATGALLLAALTIPPELMDSGDWPHAAPTHAHNNPAFKIAFDVMTPCRLIIPGCHAGVMDL
jgi:hypothetical protein